VQQAQQLGDQPARRLRKLFFSGINFCCNLLQKWLILNTVCGLRKVWNFYPAGRQAAKR
jgi:hypothetical protein